MTDGRVFDTTVPDSKITDIAGMDSTVPYRIVTVITSTVPYIILTVITETEGTMTTSTVTSVSSVCG